MIGIAVDKGQRDQRRQSAIQAALRRVTSASQQTRGRMNIMTMKKAKAST